MSDFAEPLRVTTDLSKADTILAWDVSNLAHRSYNAHLELRAGARQSGHVFGTLKTIATVLQRDLGHGRSVLHAFCYEGRGSKDSRRAILPAYKGNRKADRYNPIPDVVDVLNYVPGLHISADGHEGDDALVWCAETFKNHKVVVVSNDKDTWPLLRYANVKILKAKQGGGRVYVSPEDVKEEYGTDPEKIPLCKALHGDSDNIKGVPRLMWKQSAPYLQDPAVVDVATLFAAMAGPVRRPMTEETKAKVLAHRDIVDVNYRVIMPIKDIRREHIRMVEPSEAVRAGLLAKLSEWQCATLVREVPLFFGNPTLVDDPLTVEPEPVIVDG
jgi:5'-3' exonuclease